MGVDKEQADRRSWRKRTKLVQLSEFTRGPEWMILEVLPVIRRILRPLVPLEVDVSPLGPQ